MRREREDVRESSGWAEGSEKTIIGQRNKGKKKDPWNNKFQFKFLTRFGLYPFSGKYSKNGRLPLII